MQKLLEDIKTFGYKVPKDPELMLYDFYFMAGHMPHSHEDKVLDFVFKEALNDCTTALQKHMLAALYWALSVELRHIWRQSELKWANPKNFDQRVRGLADTSKRFLKEFTKANSVYENEYSDLMDPYRKPAKLARSRTVTSLNTNVADETNPRNKIGKSQGREESYVSSFLSVEKARKNLKLSKKEAVNCIRELYGNVDWDSSYGGKAWAAIAEAYLKLANANTPQERIVYIDHAYDLQHNTGSVFTKVRPYYKDSSLSWMASALDWKRDAEDLRGFYAKVSSSLKPVVAWVAKNQHDMTMEDFNPEAKSSAKASVPESQAAYTAEEIQRMHLEKKDEYEIGDEVIVSPDISTRKKYVGNIVNRAMLRYAGQEGTIVKDRMPGGYKLAIQGKPVYYLWTPDMLAGKVSGSRKKEAVTMAQVGSKILANPTHFAKNMSQIQDFRISDKPHSIKNAEDLLYNLATDKQRGRVLPDNVVTQLKNLTNKHGTLKAAITAWLKANPDAHTLLSELLRQGVTASQLSQADTGALRKTGTASQLQKAVRRF